MLTNRIITISILIIGICAIVIVQFLTPTLYGADGYLHIRMAEFLRDFGPRYDFHWARYSIFSENFSDKDFLYHALLIPFTFFKNIFLGAKLSAALFACVLFIGFYLLLKRYCDKRILPFFLLAFFFSEMFLSAISRPRPISLVVLIAMLSIHLAIYKKHKLLFLTALLYTLGHVTSPLILLYAAVVEAVRYISLKEFCWKTIVFALLGVLTGFIIHPNMPNNFIVFYLNSIMVPIYTIKTGVLELGAEFFPINTRQFLLGYPVLMLGLVLLIWTAVSKRPKIRFETSVFLTISMIFFILSFICMRYLLHGYPIMLISLAAYFSDYLNEGWKITKKILITSVAVIIVFSITTYKDVMYNAIVTNIVNTHYEQVGRYFNENIPEGELIFHANWSDSQYFIGLSPKHDYFVTLDPVYMYHYDKDLYKLYRDVAFGRAADPYNALKNNFGVRYGYISKNYFSGLIDQIRPDKRFEILAEDNLGVIFKLS